MKPTVHSTEAFSFNKKNNSFETTVEKLHTVSLKSFIIHNQNTGKAFEFVFSYKENKRKKTHLVYVLNRRALLPDPKHWKSVVKFNYVNAEIKDIKAIISFK